MRLAPLIAQLTSAAVSGLSGEGPEVGSLHYRSQEVRPGGLFVAIEGLAADGHDFIDDALRRGAVAVVAQRPVARPAVVARVPDSRRALAELACAFYGHPSRRMTVVAVTGTNGKTTTTYLLESILTRAGIRPGVVGTITTRWGGVALESPVTTPESLELQRLLAEMAAAGTTHAVIEASSHAIALARLHGCWLDAAVFTNLSQDHLDFHGDMEAYWAVKQRLFTEHLAAGPKAPGAAAVINTDSPHGRALAAALAGRRRTVRVGTGGECDLRGTVLACGLEGIRGEIAAPGRRLAFASPLVGRHNVENILCAAGAAWALGVAPEAIAAGIDALAGVPGRLERVAGPGGRFVFVDYAHTPDALQNALAALRALCPGRLICVFGCGGDRDRTKRPRMGAIAARLSDAAVVTSDNPRREDPAAIIAEVLPGLQAQGLQQVAPERLGELPAKTAFAAEPDRQRAIAAAIRAARPGDAVLIAGKGHETYQIIGDRRRHFDDREAAAAVLEEL